MIANFKPTVELWEQEPGLDGMLKHIERCGRISYKSEDKITDDSYNEFVNRMLVNHHLSVLEHGSVYLKIPVKAETSYRIDSYKDNTYSKTRINQESDGWYYYISTNYRVLVEHNWVNDLKYLCEPTEYHEKRYTFHIITDRGVSAEGNRHRKNSITERSTRYCDYSGGKFGGQVRIIVPNEFSDYDRVKVLERINKDHSTGMDMLQSFCGMIASRTEDGRMQEFELWLFANLACEYSYHRLRKLGWTSQQARRVLPLDLETEVAYTAFKWDWEHFLELRCDKLAHPDMQVIANKIKETLNL